MSNFYITTPIYYVNNIANAVRAYRRYYVNDKKDIAKWEKSRPMPKWFTMEGYKL